MKIYTRTGDEGKTSLFSGERVGKDSLRVEVYGTLDELNSVLGVASAFCRDELTRSQLAELQSLLFSAGADLATRSSSRRRVSRIGRQDWERLERWIDRLEEGLEPLRRFILPGGSPAAAFLHLARTVCRRGERLLVRLVETEGSVNGELLIFLNRLSDHLFVLARHENRTQGVSDVIWEKGE